MSLPRPLSFDATHGLGGRAAYDTDFVVELDSQGGLGDGNRDGLLIVDPAEGDLLTDDHDHPGVACAPLQPDRLR